MPEKLQFRMEEILDETNPLEVESMVSNLALTLDEMQMKAEERGIEKEKHTIAQQQY